MRLTAKQREVIDALEPEGWALVETADVSGRTLRSLAERGLVEVAKTGYGHLLLRRPGVATPAEAPVPLGVDGLVLEPVASALRFQVEPLGESVEYADGAWCAYPRSGVWPKEPIARYATPADAAKAIAAAWAAVKLLFTLAHGRAPKLGELWAEPYNWCRVCGAALSAEQIGWARQSYQRGICSSECSRAEIKARYACCDKAEFTPCVCMYSFHCETHGDTHIGTHD